MINKIIGRHNSRLHRKKEYLYLDYLRSTIIIKDSSISNRVPRSLAFSLFLMIPLISAVKVLYRPKTLSNQGRHAHTYCISQHQYNNARTEEKLLLCIINICCNNHIQQPPPNNDNNNNEHNN